ncbi:MAG: efflux RND transporter periplasmic adaptor subunit [bacterium]
MKKRLILIVFLLLMLGVGTLVYLGQRRAKTAELHYSGTIEATQANLSFQISGRVIGIPVDEGVSVTKDQILAELDPEEFAARRNEVLASLVLSRETLKEIEVLLALYSDTLPADVERAAAALRSLKANYNELKSGYRAQEVEQARLAVSAAEITMEKARKDRERFSILFSRNIVSQKDMENADVRYETFLKDYERAREGYNLLKQGFRRESIESAQAKLAEGRAVLKQAKSNLKKIDATAAQVDAARARVQAAEAALSLAEIQLRNTRLKTPFNGIITSRNIELGEVVSPGREVFSLSDLSEVDLKVFVDETQIGKVKPGQKVEVKTDTFPDRVYNGRVAFISPDGEFTPKIIQTRKERVKLVYLVKVAIPNPNLELKSGMPADAWFQ